VDYKPKVNIPNNQTVLTNVDFICNHGFRFQISVNSDSILSELSRLPSVLNRG